MEKPVELIIATFDDENRAEEVREESSTGSSRTRKRSRLLSGRRPKSSCAKRALSL